MNHSNKTILLVDDEDLFRQMTRKLIEFRLGASVVESANPKEAFEYLKLHSPDLILLDMEMPVMDGFTALKHIRNIPSLRNIPVIIFTALLSKQLIAEVYKLQISDYIVKPSHPNSVIEKIEKALMFGAKNGGSSY